MTFISTHELICRPQAPTPEAVVNRFHTAVLELVHRQWDDLGRSIALDWPEWTQGETPSLGRILRLVQVGQPEASALQQIQQQIQSSLFVRNGLIHLELRPLPEHRDEVACVRVRGLDRSQFKRRARGADPDRYLALRNAAEMNQSYLQTLPRLQRLSVGTGKPMDRFVARIKKELYQNSRPPNHPESAQEPRTPMLSSFGLSTMAHPLWLPEFR